MGKVTQSDRLIYQEYAAMANSTLITNVMHSLQCNAENILFNMLSIKMYLLYDISRVLWFAAFINEKQTFIAML